MIPDVPLVVLSLRHSNIWWQSACTSTLLLGVIVATGSHSATFLRFELPKHGAGGLVRGGATSRLSEELLLLC